MGFSHFHFAAPQWLWGLALIIPALGLYRFFFNAGGSDKRLAAFADKHLLPHLLKSHMAAVGSIWRSLSLWAVIFACIVIALAGPRWRYTDMQVFKPENDLVIVLDLSRSMNAADVKPSRMAQAREEISDLLDMNHGLTIGLVAYAAVPHMVLPLTDDMNTIRNLLPSLDTSLISIDGDRLQPALALAAQMLRAEPGHHKSILVISDGDFRDADAGELAKAAQGAMIYTMGIGTKDGAPIPVGNGYVKGDDEHILIDPLHADRLQALAGAGQGLYVEATYNNSDTRRLLDHIGHAGDDAKVAGKTIRSWEEEFYIPALIAAALLLPFFRKGALFPVIILLAFGAAPAQAAGFTDWFRNPDQQAEAAYNAGHYDEAAGKFSDPYQQGVAAYKAGYYEQAANLFKAASAGTTPLSAEYNLGNAQLLQNQPEAAIKSYENVLKQKPADASAKHNLEIAREMLKQQKQDQQNQADKSQPGQQRGSGQKDQQGQNSNDKDQNQAQQDAQNGAMNKQGGQQSGQQGKDQQQSASQSGNQQNGNQPQQDQGKQGQQTPQGASQSQSQSQANQSGQQPPQSSGDANQQQGQGTGTTGQADQQQRHAPNELPQSSQSGAGFHDAEQTQPSDNQPQAATTLHQRQLDFDANQWLNHIQSDPASFLKNQFLIEEQESGQQEPSR